MDNDTKFPEFPVINDQLIAALSARFPTPIPEPSMTDRDIWIKRGQWSVIEFLKIEQERQTAKINW
jgi:hypothetical protein